MPLLWHIKAIWYEMWHVIISIYLRSKQHHMHLLEQDEGGGDYAAPDH